MAKCWDGSATWLIIPSEEHGLKLHPLDFEEFLDAMGASMMKEQIRTCFNEGRALGAGVHGKALDLFRLYMVVGGMPQSVAAYLDAEDRKLDASEVAKREILRLYEQDIGKYAKGYAAKVRAIFRMIPGALSKHEKKFHLADIDKNARMRRYENAFLWLADAMGRPPGAPQSIPKRIFRCISIAGRTALATCFASSASPRQI